MEIEFQAGNYSGVVCDMLAYPVFEEEKNLPPALRASSFPVPGYAE